MNDYVLPIKNPKELKHIFEELYRFDLRLYALCYIVVRTAEKPQVLFALKVEDLIPFKEYTSTYGYTLQFTKEFSETLISLAEGKNKDELIFKASATGAIPTTQLFSTRFYYFKNKTGISLNFPILQRTFIYNHFITTGTMPAHAPTRYHNPYRNYIQTHLDITDKEYYAIKNGERMESIFTDILPGTLRTPNTHVQKRIDAIHDFCKKNIKDIEKTLRQCSDAEYSLILQALTELNDSVKKLMESHTETL